MSGGEAGGTIPDNVADAEATRAAPAKDSEPKAKEAGTPAVVDKPGVKIRQPGLVHGVISGDPVKFREFPEDRIHEPQGREVEISQETAQKYEDLAVRYIASYNSMTGEKAPTGNTDLYEYVLNSKGREADKLFMDRFSKAIKDKEGNTIAREVDETAVREFFQSGNQANWMGATAVLESYALWAQMGLGVHATVDAPIYNNPKGEGKSIIHDSSPTLRRGARHLLSRTVVAGGAVLYALGGRGTTDIPFKDDVDVLYALKANATDADKAYLRKIVGVDLDMIDISQALDPVTGLPTGKRSLSYKGQYTPNTEAIKTSIDNVYTARKDFLRQTKIDEPPTTHFGLNIDRSANIRLPEEFIFDPSRDPEGLSVPYAMEILDKFNVLGGQVTTDRYKRLRLWEQARVEVAVKYLETSLKVEKAGRSDGKLDALKTKRKDMENPTYRAKRKTEHEEKRKEAEEARDAAKTKKAELVDKIPEQTTAISDLENELLSMFDIPLNENFAQGVKDKLSGLKAEIEGVEGDDDKPGLKKSLREKKKEKARKIVEYNGVVTGRMDSHTRAIETIAGALTQMPTGDKDKPFARPQIPETPKFDALIGRQEKAANEEFDGEIEDIKAELDEKQKQFSELEAKFKQYQLAVHTRETTMHSIAAREPGQLKASKDAYDKFIAGGISDDDVQKLSADNLAEQLLGTANYEKLSPEDKADKIQEAIWAKAETAARKEENEIKIPAHQLDALSRVTAAGIGISEDDLMSRSKSELRGILRFSTSPIEDDDVARELIVNAYSAASRRLQVRVKARSDIEIKYYEDIIKDENKKIEDLGKLDPHKEELDAAIKIIDDLDPIYTRVSEIPGDKKKEQELFDRTKVTAADTTYSSAEIVVGAEKAYYGWLRLLHGDYIKDSANRDEVFNSLHRTLPPEKLAELLNEHLGFGYVTPTIDLVFKKIQYEFSKGKLGVSDLQPAVKQITDYVRDRALTL